MDVNLDELLHNPIYMNLMKRYIKLQDEKSVELEKVRKEANDNGIALIHKIWAKHEWIDRLHEKIKMLNEEKKMLKEKCYHLQEKIYLSTGETEKLEIFKKYYEKRIIKLDAHEFENLRKQGKYIKITTQMLFEDYLWWIDHASSSKAERLFRREKTVSGHNIAIGKSTGSKGLWAFCQYKTKTFENALWGYKISEEDIDEEDDEVN
tara:strand:- start:1740 stop:2360 length:621 start_codon:yes stop_codon:yes gene_type:complete